MRNPDLKCIATYVSPSTYKMTHSLAVRLGMSKATLLNRVLELVIDNPQILADSILKSIQK